MAKHKDDRRRGTRFKIYKSPSSKRSKVLERKCLRCDKLFKTNKGAFVCPSCHEINRKFDDGQTYHT